MKATAEPSRINLHLTVLHPAKRRPNDYNSGKLDGETPKHHAHTMKANYVFQNLCGTVYRQGNVLFTPDGNSVLSPVGNRVSVFDLIKWVGRNVWL